MEIIRESEIVETVDGKLKFWKNFVIRQDRIVSYGTWNDRSSKPTDMGSLRRTINTNERGPKVQETRAVASQEDCYLKAPGLTDLMFSELEDDIQRDLEVCEVIYTYRGEMRVSVLLRTYPRICKALQYKYLPQTTTSTDIIAIVLIEQIRKEIKVPWLLLSKRPGERRIREERKKRV